MTASIPCRSSDGRIFEVRGVPGVLRAGEHLVVDGSLLLVEDVVPGAEVDVGRAVTLGEDGPTGPSRARPATDDEVAGLLRGRPPRAVLGRLTSRPEVPVGLLAHRLNRHTFWCGQSGSGKTYALGVALEQVLLHTRLPLLVLDPNSDFVHLDQPVESCPPAVRERLAEREVRVLRAGGGGLEVRFRDMTPRARAAVLRLDPVQDRHEYNVLSRMTPRDASGGPAAIRAALDAVDEREGPALRERLENLGVLDWGVWSWDRPPALEVVDRRPAATVLDLGSLGSVEEQHALSLAVLDHLWERREDREPRLVVVDEAHTLCSPELDTPLGLALVDRLVQIAAEGRKYGIWLLVSTQRPARVHRGVVSQCDNLTLMRMNSPADLAELGEIFGFVPHGMLARAPRFRQGEALVAGGFVAAPSVLRVGPRLTEQGGIDVPVPMET